MASAQGGHDHNDPGVPGEIPIERITLPEILTRTAGRYPDRTALNFLGRRIVYRDLEALVNRVARGLAAMGVARGERVALLLPNMPQLVAASYGALKVGAVPVLLDPLEEEADLLQRVGEAGARVLFALDLLYPRAAELREKGGIQTVVSCHISDHLPFPGNRLLPIFKGKLYCKIPLAAGNHEFLAFTGCQSDAPLESAARWEEAGVWLYTGAADGGGRAVELSHANLSAAVQQLRAGLPEARDGAEALLSVFPLFHPFGWTAMQNLPILAGWANILVPRSEPPTVVDLTRRYRPTLLPGSPAVFTHLLGSEAFRKLDLTCLKAFLVGGAPVPGRMVRALKALRDIPLINLYGLTETGGVAAATPWGAPAPDGALGVPLPHTDLRVLAPEGEEVPAGALGEIALRGPQVAAAEAGPDGWLRTGDMGRLDAGGWLTVTDRREARIAIGGAVFYPSEVEAVLLAHPKVLEAAVVDADDGEGGRLVKACLVLRPYEEGDKREIIAFCQERLEAPRAPRIVEFVAELPRNAMGRVLRPALREAAAPAPAKGA